MLRAGRGWMPPALLQLGVLAQGAALPHHLIHPARSRPSSPAGSAATSPCWWTAVRLQAAGRVWVGGQPRLLLRPVHQRPTARASILALPPQASAPRPPTSWTTPRAHVRSVGLPLHVCAPAACALLPHASSPPCKRTQCIWPEPCTPNALVNHRAHPPAPDYDLYRERKAHLRSVEEEVGGLPAGTLASDTAQDGLVAHHAGTPPATTTHALHPAPAPPLQVAEMIRDGAGKVRMADADFDFR